MPQRDRGRPESDGYADRQGYVALLQAGQILAQHRADRGGGPAVLDRLTDQSVHELRDDPVEAAGIDALVAEAERAEQDPDVASVNGLATQVNAVSSTSVMGKTKLQLCGTALRNVWPQWSWI